MHVVVVVDEVVVVGEVEVAGAQAVAVRDDLGLRKSFIALIAVKKVILLATAGRKRVANALPQGVALEAKVEAEAVAGAGKVEVIAETSRTRNPPKRVRMTT